MKIKDIFLFLGLVAFTCLVYSQNKPKHVSHVYVPFSYYKTNYKSSDSLGVMYKDSDTLIQVANFKKPKGVGVPYEPKDSTFLELYKTVAFQPNPKKRNKTYSMKYWKEDINIYFTNSISKSVKKELNKFTSVIDAEIDSLTINVVKDIENANYIVYTEKDTAYEENLDNNQKAGYYIYWNKKSQINKGFLRLNSSALFSDLLQIREAKKLFIQSLGWFVLNRKLDCQSYFSNCHSDNKTLSDLDLALLKYHYSYGICKGTDRTTFEEQHQRAKESLKRPNSSFVIYHEE